MPTDAAPHILFATIAAGGSHVSTARAMAEAVARAGGEGRVYEPMAEYGFEAFDRQHKESWRWMLGNPASIVWGQRIIDAVPRVTVQLLRWRLDAFARVAAERIPGEGADLVVANHGWLAVALTRAQRRYGLQTPVVTFETSTLNANALWADPELERCVTASPRNAARLAELGVPAERIDVVGYPVRAPFLFAPAKREARRRLGLDAEAFTVLVMFGGEGIGRGPHRTLDAVATLGPEVQPLVVAGRNEELAAALRGGRDDLPRLRVDGFVPDLGVHVAAADVVVAKTGPATVYEALAVGRPVLAPERFGLAETRMAEMLERSNLGGAATSAPELTARLARYRDDPEALDAVRRRAAELDFEGMADRLARYLVTYARSRVVPAGVVGRGLPWGADAARE